MLAILEYIVLGFAVELIVSVVTKNAYIEPLQRYEYENEIGIFLSRMVIFWIVLLLGYFSHHRNEIEKSEIIVKIRFKKGMFATK